MREGSEAGRVGRRLIGGGAVDRDDDETAVGDLEHRAIAKGELAGAKARGVEIDAAEDCRAEQHAMGVGDQGAARFKPVVAGEIDQRRGRACVAANGLEDLEHRAIGVRAGADIRAELVSPDRRAEQVAVGVGDQADDPLGGIVEANQGGERAVAGGGLDEFEHRAVAVGAAARGRAEQIAVGVRDQPADWAGAIVAVEINQRCGDAGITAGGLDEFEHRAIAVGAAA